MVENIVINECPRCGELHSYEIKGDGIRDGISINLACLNIQRYHRLAAFHFDGTANALRSGFLDISESLIKEYGINDFENKKKRIIEFGTYILITDEYNQFLTDIQRCYIMGYTYPFVVSCCTLFERILNVMIMKLRSYHTDSPHYKKVYSKETIQDWEKMIITLKDWGYLSARQSILFGKFKEYRNEAVHYNKDYPFKIKEKIILSEFMELLKSLFGLFERVDIVRMVPGEFWINPSIESNPFVIEFFIPNTRMSAYAGNIFDSNYSEEGVVPGKIDPDKFFQLREDSSMKSLPKVQIKFQDRVLYGCHVNIRVI